MLDNGDRGIILELTLLDDIKNIQSLLDNNELYQEKVNNAIQWSRKYTLDVFEEEIKLLIKS
jgi:hypothetical protein